MEAPLEISTEWDLAAATAEGQRILRTEDTINIFKLNKATK